jgi:hypothetical protein
LGGGLILLPEQQRFEQLCEQVSDRLTGAGPAPDDLLATLPDARNGVSARLYRKKPSGRCCPTPFSREVSGDRRIRLFLDSNVLTGCLVSAWGLDQATLSLCAAKVCRLKYEHVFPRGRVAGAATFSKPSACCRISPHHPEQEAVRTMHELCMRQEHERAVSFDNFHAVLAAEGDSCLAH